MKASDRIAMVYTISALGSAGLSYWKGNRDLKTIGSDALLHGALFGTGVNLILWLREDHDMSMGLLKANPGDSGSMGKMAVEGVRILSQVNPEKLYRVAKMAGVSIGPEPADPNIVDLPEE